MNQATRPTAVIKNHSMPPVAELEIERSYECAAGIWLVPSTGRFLADHGTIRCELRQRPVHIAA